MNIPFRLNIFKQIELYQELQEVEQQSNSQLHSVVKEGLDEGFIKNPPTWFFEKKILHWAYKKHKHLASPLRILRLTFGEASYDYIHESTIYKIADDFKEMLPVVKENQKDMHYTQQEADTTQIRKVFGNLVVKGFAKFFKEKENNYWNINQENCDGIFLTPKGLDYARMINKLYEFRDAKGDYKKIRGVSEVLEIKTSQRYLFGLYICISWLIIIGSIVLFFLTLINSFMSLITALCSLIPLQALHNFPPTPRF